MKRWWFVIGAVLILAGGLALLRSLLEALGIMFRVGWIFWPVVLIGVGVWLVLGFSRGGSGQGEVPREQASVPLDGATEASVVVHHGAGRLSIGGGAGPEQLLAGSFGGGLNASTTRSGNRIDVDMKIKDRDVSHYIFGPWNRGWAGMLDWDFTVNSSIPLTLRLETGASETRLSLADVQVRDLKVQTGASSTVIELPARAGYTRLTVEAGAASVKIRVPPEVAAAIQAKSALAGINVDKVRFPHGGGGWRSPNYDAAANKVEIFVETGVGSIDIR